MKIFQIKGLFKSYIILLYQSASSRSKKVPTDLIEAFRQATTCYFNLLAEPAEVLKNFWAGGAISNTKSFDGTGFAYKAKKCKASS